MHRLVALLLTIALLAGCASNGPDNKDPVEPEPAVILADALAAYLAGNASANVDRLAHWDGGGAEADAWGDWLFVDAGSGVQVLNTSNPNALEEVARVTGFPGILDVKVSDDGKWLFVGEDQEGSSEPLGGTGSFTGGFYAVDISDLANPGAPIYKAVGPRRGPHMIFYHNTTGGDELLFGANADVSINRFDRAAGTITELARYAPDFVTGFNRDPQVFDVLYQGWAHDMFVMEDPIENRTMMYVANWDAGLRIVDLSDPARPTELGGWNDFPDGHEGNLHTVSTEWIGDRRITVGSVEVGFAVVGGYHYAMGTDRGVLYVWDTTDAANVKLLGVWENPEGLPSGRDNPIFGEEVTSTHNLQLEHGRVYLAHYCLGVFVLDVSTPQNQTTPSLVAYHKEPSDNVWDVVLNNGVLYSTGAVGVVGLHFLPDVLGPMGIDSRA